MSDTAHQPHLLSDQHYLLNDQYKDASKLNARIELHRRYSTNPIPLFRWIFDQFKIAPDSRVLELGGGTGELWLVNQDRLPPDWDITLSDLSGGMVQEAQRTLQTSNHAFSYQIIDAQSIPFADEHFDCVIANFMLYHVPDCARALSEIRRVLKSEGCFYAATVGASHLHEITEFIQRVDENYTRDSKFLNTFTLETGEEEIAQWFAHVGILYMEDALVVTEVNSLLAYILSGKAKSILIGEKLCRLRELIEQDLAQHGAIHITKVSGLFEAYGRK